MSVPNSLRLCTEVLWAQLPAKSISLSVFLWSVTSDDGGCFSLSSMLDSFIRGVATPGGPVHVYLVYC